MSRIRSIPRRPEEVCHFRGVVLRTAKSNGGLRRKTSRTGSYRANKQEDFVRDTQPTCISGRQLGAFSLLHSHRKLGFALMDRMTTVGPSFQPTFNSSARNSWFANRMPAFAESCQVAISLSLAKASMSDSSSSIKAHRAPGTCPLAKVRGLRVSRSTNSKFTPSTACKAPLRSFRVVCYFISTLTASGQVIPLVVPAGTPLQIKIEKRIRIQSVNQQIEGRLVVPVFVFNSEVMPAGTEVIGHIVRLIPVNRQKRFKAILNGDFTPLKEPEIQFDMLKLPDGQTIPVKTGIASQWSVIAPSEKRMQAHKKSSLISKTFELTRAEVLNACQEIVTEINSQPKWDRLQEEAYSRLPYHPQFLSANTRLSAQLKERLAFGIAAIAAGEMEVRG